MLKHPSTEILVVRITSSHCENLLLQESRLETSRKYYLPILPVIFGKIYICKYVFVADKRLLNYEIQKSKIFFL